MCIEDMAVGMRVIFKPVAFHDGTRISKEDCDPDGVCDGRIIKIDGDSGLVKVAWNCLKAKASSGNYWYYFEQCAPMSSGGF